MKKIIVIGMGSIGQRHLHISANVFPSAKIYSLGCRPYVHTPNDLKHSFKDRHKGVTILETIADIYPLKPDAVIIASPSSEHMVYVETLLKHNIPCLVEKPLSDNVKKAKQQLTLMQSNKIALGYTFRFSRLLNQCKEIINSNQYGKIIHASIHTNQYLPDWRPKCDYRLSVSAQKKLGGGVLLELSHEIDIIIWLMGSVESVCAGVSSSKTLDVDVEDTVDALLKLNSGATVNLHLDMMQRVPSRRYLIAFERGSIAIDMIAQTLSRCSGNSRIWDQEHIPQSRDEIFSDQLLEFSNYIKGGVWSGASIEEGLHTLNIIESIHLSSRDGIWSRVNYAG